MSSAGVQEQKRMGGSSRRQRVMEWGVHAATHVGVAGWQGAPVLIRTFLERALSLARVEMLVLCRLSAHRQPPLLIKLSKCGLPARVVQGIALVRSSSAFFPSRLSGSRFYPNRASRLSIAASKKPMMPVLAAARAGQLHRCRLASDSSRLIFSACTASSFPPGPAPLW